MHPYLQRAFPTVPSTQLMQLEDARLRRSQGNKQNKQPTLRYGYIEGILNEIFVKSCSVNDCIIETADTKHCRVLVILYNPYLSYLAFPALTSERNEIVMPHCPNLMQIQEIGIGQQVGN